MKTEASAEKASHLPSIRLKGRRKAYFKDFKSDLKKKFHSLTSKLKDSEFSKKLKTQIIEHKNFIYVLMVLLLVSFLSMPLEGFFFLVSIVMLVLFGLLLLMADLKYLIYYMIFLV